MERMKAAALRLGSQGLRTSYDDHLLIIGDAAGHIDPLTGEGIHTAIMVRSLLDIWQVLADPALVNMSAGRSASPSQASAHMMTEDMSMNFGAPVCCCLCCRDRLLIRFVNIPGRQVRSGDDPGHARHGRLQPAVHKGV